MKKFAVAVAHPNQVEHRVASQLKFVAAVVVYHFLPYEAKDAHSIVLLVVEPSSDVWAHHQVLLLHLVHVAHTDLVAQGRHDRNQHAEKICLADVA